MIKAQIAAFFSLMVMETEAIKLKEDLVPSMSKLYWDATTLLQGIADNLCEERYSGEAASLADCRANVASSRKNNESFMYWDANNDNEIESSELPASIGQDDQNAMLEYDRDNDGMLDRGELFDYWRYDGTVFEDDKKASPQQPSDSEDSSGDTSGDTSEDTSGDASSNEENKKKDKKKKKKKKN